MTLHLKELSRDDEKILVALHHWSEAETQREMYTCRPVISVKGLEEYIRTTRNRLDQRIIRIFVLMSDDDEYLYGKVTAFDYNSRNQSAEFGYYFPLVHRGKGYGRTAVKEFLDVMFKDNDWKLNKLYATTASGNVPSTRLLKRYGFHLDGIMREHYWIAGQVEDQLHYSLLKREWERR